MYVWVDGEVRRDAEVTVSPWSHTLHYGMGVVEGIRCYDGARGPMVFRLRDHLLRFVSSTRSLGMRMTWDVPLLTGAVLETLRVNGLGDAYIRPLVYYGPGSMSLDSRDHPVRTLILAWNGNSDYENTDPQGLAVRVVSYRRLSASSALVHAKAVGNYLNSQLAFREAVSCGADEALLLDERGYLAEAPAANLFLVREGRLYTPTTVNALKGLTRDTMMVLARRLGRPVVETDLTREDLYRADEAFFVGTARGIQEIASVDGQSIANRRQGSVAGELREVYRSLVRAEGRGLAILKPGEVGHWLTRVYARGHEPLMETVLKVAE